MAVLLSITLSCYLLVAVLGYPLESDRSAIWNHLAIDVDQQLQNDLNTDDSWLDAGIMSLSHSRRKRNINASSEENGTFSLILDPDSNFQLLWIPIYSERTIEFRIRIRNLPPQSWFAIGFSDFGDWQESNVCVAWEDWKGHLYVQDAHTDENGILHVDTINNCQKASFQRRGLGAFIEFRRPFQTCDEDDYIIEDGTTNIVYATGSGPLYQLDGVHPLENDYGFQRTRLLQPQIPSPVHPSDTRSLTVTASKVSVPAQETTYWCHVSRLPDHFRHKHHIFQFEAAVEEGHESLVHHMEVFHCEAPANEFIPEYRGPCTDNSRPESTRVCKRVLAAWAYGAGPFVYPQEAGLPIGGPDFNPYVMLEVHYNNPSLRSDWIDSSGIRLWYTKQLRQYDAGVLELGLEYTDKMAIPPGVQPYTLTGYCLPQCTAVSLPRDGITIFGSQLHTHLLGYRVVTQHFRHGEELPELDRDNHYSTHYQEIRLLAKPIHVLPGDTLLTTCWFNSLHKKNVTLGGFSISDEMCVNYVHYFPRVNLEVCKSSIGWDALRNYFKFLDEWEDQTTSPEKGVADNYKSIQWTPLRAATLSELYRSAPISMQCNQSSGERFPGNWEGLPPFPFQLPTTEQPPIPKHCSDKKFLADEYEAKHRLMLNV